MGARKIDLQYTAIADAARIEGDPDSFRVPGRAGANHLVMRRIGPATSITGNGTGDALNMLEHTRADAERAEQRVVAVDPARLGVEPEQHAVEFAHRPCTPIRQASSLSAA